MKIALDQINPSIGDLEDSWEKILREAYRVRIAHRLSTVQTADRLFVLDEGRIVQRGTHAELMQEGGLYRRLASYQFREPSEVNDA